MLLNRSSLPFEKINIKEHKELIYVKHIKFSSVPQYRTSLVAPQLTNGIRHLISQGIRKGSLQNRKGLELFQFCSFISNPEMEEE